MKERELSKVVKELVETRKDLSRISFESNPLLWDFLTRIENRLCDEIWEIGGYKEMDEIVNYYGDWDLANHDE